MQCVYFLILVWQQCAVRGTQKSHLLSASSQLYIYVTSWIHSNWAGNGIEGNSARFVINSVTQLSRHSDGEQTEHVLFTWHQLLFCVNEILKEIYNVNFQAFTTTIIKTNIHIKIKMIKANINGKRRFNRANYCRASKAFCCTLTYSFNQYTGKLMGKNSAVNKHKTCHYHKVLTNLY